MDAKTARQIAEKTKSSAINKSFDEIMTNILRDSKQGHFESHYYKSIPFETTVKLEELGYKVSKPLQSGPNEMCVTIKW
jgi:hypothetical protein